MIKEKIILLFIVISNCMLYPILDPDAGFLSSHHKFLDKSSVVKESEFTETTDMSFVLGSSYYGDTQNYIKMAKGELSFSPYKYRILYPMVIGFMSDFWFGSRDYIPIIYTSILFNYLLCLCIFLISISFFRRISKFPVLISLCIITSPGIFKTIPNLMIEIPSVLIMILILINWNRRWLLPILILISMFIKEVFVLLSIPLFFFFLKKRSMRYLIYSLIPPLVFVLMRIWFKDDPLTVNYGWNLSQGEFKLHYLKGKFTSITQSIITIFRFLFILFPITLIFFKRSFSIKCFLKSNIHWIFFIISILVSGLFLSSRLIRPWVIITPVLFYLVYIHQNIFLNEKETISI